MLFKNFVRGKNKCFAVVDIVVSLFQYRRYTGNQWTSLNSADKIVIKPIIKINNNIINI